MSIWDSVELKKDESGKVSMETGGGFFSFPDGYTDTFALVEGKITEWPDGGKSCQIKVNALAGEHKGKETNINLNIYHDDEKKRTRAWEFAKAIDMIFGGKHIDAGAEPSEMSIMKHWCNKPIVMRLGCIEVTKNDGSTRLMNYLQGVYEKGAKESSAGKVIEPSNKPASSPKPASTPAPGFDNALDDDIPF